MVPLQRESGGESDWANKQQTGFKQARKKRNEMKIATKSDKLNRVRARDCRWLGWQIEKNQRAHTNQDEEKSRIEWRKTEIKSRENFNNNLEKHVREPNAQRINALCTP